MPKGKVVSEDGRNIVYNVYQYFVLESTKFKTDDGYFQKIQNRVAQATGMSIKFVFSVIGEKLCDSIENKKRKLDGADSQGSNGNSSLGDTTTATVTKTIEKTKTTVSKPGRKYKMWHRGENPPKDKIKVQKLKDDSTSASKSNTSLDINKDKNDLTSDTAKQSSLTDQQAFTKIGPQIIQVLSRTSNKGKSLIKLYPIPSNSPLGISKTPKVIQLDPRQQLLTIETNTVPIEFDPGSPDPGCSKTIKIDKEDVVELDPGFSTTIKIEREEDLD